MSLLVLSTSLSTYFNKYLINAHLIEVLISIIPIYFNAVVTLILTSFKCPVRHPLNKYNSFGEKVTNN